MQKAHPGTVTLVLLQTVPRCHQLRQRKQAPHTSCASIAQFCVSAAATSAAPFCPRGAFLLSFLRQVPDRMAVAARTKIQVSVVSDTVCPWCFVGECCAAANPDAHPGWSKQLLACMHHCSPLCSTACSQVLLLLLLLLLHVHARRQEAAGGSDEPAVSTQRRL